MVTGACHFLMMMTSINLSTYFKFMTLFFRVRPSAVKNKVTVI